MENLINIVRAVPFKKLGGVELSRRLFKRLVKKSVY